MNGTYQEQLDRAKRYLNLFQQINDGKAHDQPSHYYDDVVLTFFQHCYHVKDWIKHDPACSAWSNPDHFINQTPDLALCADICNASKHLALTKPPRSGAIPTFGSSHVTLKIGGGPVVVSITYQIDTGNGTVDAFELAKRCIDAWDRFVASNP